MSKKNILLAITNGLWLIDWHSAEQLGYNVASVLSGEKFWIDKDKSQAEFILAHSENTHFSETLSTAKPNSVAVISISGPLIKEDNCGEPGTKTFASMIQQADANPNITGIVLQIDSPGGTVAGTQSLSEVIKSVNKPIVTVAEDMMASAAYWIGSSSDFVFASNSTTRIGSIGTMISFSDMQPAWEKLGVKFHTINASASTHKNADYEEARKGNYDDLIKNTLDPLNNEFLKSVKANRGDKLDASQTLSGKVFLASEALKHGLIDAIGNLQQAIDKVHELANNPNQATQTTNHKMKKITLLASQAALIALCGATIAPEANSVDVELTDDLIEKLNDSLVDGANANAELNSLKEKLSASEKLVSDLTAKVSSLEAKISVLETPSSTSPVKTGNDNINSNADDAVWSLEHNKKALENPLFH